MGTVLRRALAEENASSDAHCARSCVWQAVARCYACGCMADPNSARFPWELPEGGVLISGLNQRMTRRINPLPEAAEAMDPSAISEQVGRILHSRMFTNKSQLRKLLEVLHQYMDSQSSLKADGVIRELWPDEIRTKRPSDVATEMNRLRHALETFYAEEGRNDPILITLPSRSAAALDGSVEKRWIAASPRVSELKQSSPSPAIRPRNVRRILLMAAAAALLVIAYGTIQMSRGDTRPQLGRLDGSTLRILNADGKELWTKTFPDGIRGDSYYESLHGPVWFADLEGHGRTDVLFPYFPAGNPLSHSSTVICYSDRGKEKWRWTPGRELPELKGSPATFMIVSFGVLKDADKRPPRIVISSQYFPWWPSQVAILDAHGKLLSEYWHSGVISYMTFADLDGDGREEIILAGVANGYDHQATLVVLDPDRVFGASTEVRPEFQIHGMGAAQERLRLLFPRSDLNRALFQFNQAMEPTVEQGRPRLTVAECITPSYGCRIWYEFDKDFHLTAAFAGSDEFRSAHERFYQTGKNAHTLSAGEQAAFQKVRCLVGCKSEYVPIGNLIP